MFLRRMLDGTLELGRSVLIVDEVDDLIVNEKPNAHYVKVAAIEVRSMVCTANPNPNPSPLGLAISRPDRRRAYAGAGLLSRGAARGAGQAGGRGGDHVAL